MKKDALTVKEFAELAGVSVQSVYKKINKLNHPIQRYLKEVDGVKYIEYMAYEVLYNSQNITKEDDEDEYIIAPPQPQEKNSTDRLLDILEKQLEEQRRQLIEKDKQIASQNEHIESLLKRLEESSQIINQQQQLTAMNTKALESNNTAAANVNINNSAADKEINEPASKKGNILKRIFGKS